VGVDRVAAFSILALTVSLSLTRPRIGRLRIQHAIAACLGALLCLALGLVPLDLVALALRLLFFPILTIVSLMVITLIAEKVGLFDMLAGSIAVAARGDGRRLFRYLFFCGTLTGAFFTNDAAVLIFTPLVFRLIERVQEPSWTDRNKLPYYFAVLYVANLVGVLAISNPINLVVSSLFHISFIEYATWMFLPALASIVVSFVGLRLVFRKSLPATYDRSPVVAPQPRDRRLVALCSVVLAATLAGFFTESLTGVPTWLVAFSGAATLLGLYASVGRGRIGSVLSGVSWDVLIFVVGIFVVALGLRNVGLTHQIGELIAGIGRHGISALTTGTALLAATCSSVMNNHPTAYWMAWVIRDLHAPALETRAMVFSALIGGDLGPKMLPIGSLAARIWFRLLRDRGVRVPYSLYIKICITLTLAAILASVLVLNGEIALAARFLPH
jgi:arsenical pump membrane protein